MAAYYRHGETTMIDYTPAGAVAAGATITCGGGTGIIHNPIAAGALGAMSIPNGNCVYEIEKTTLTDTFALFASVEITHATATAEVATAGDADIGIAVKVSAATDPNVWVLCTALDAPAT